MGQPLKFLCAERTDGPPSWNHVEADSAAEAAEAYAEGLHEGRGAEWTGGTMMVAPDTSVDPAAEAECFLVTIDWSPEYNAFLVPRSS
jgi:hypothetical protein